MCFDILNIDGMIGLFIKRGVIVVGLYSVVVKWVLYILVCFKYDVMVGCWLSIG